jgi:hypothetical protein
MWERPLPLAALLRHLCQLLYQHQMQQERLIC